MNSLSLKPPPNLINRSGVAALSVGNASFREKNRRKRPDCPCSRTVADSASACPEWLWLVPAAREELVVTAHIGDDGPPESRPTIGEQLDARLGRDITAHWLLAERVEKLAKFVAQQDVTLAEVRAAVAQLQHRIGRHP